jgi:hypothetical protein
MDTGKDHMPNTRTRARALPELLVIIGLSVAVYLLSSRYDILENIVRLSHRYEHLEVDEIITVSIFLMFSLLFFSIRRWREAKSSEALSKRRSEELEKALSEVRQIRGMITICSVCRRVRTDEGFWQQIEVYVRDHSDAEFTHGICKECAKKLYPELQEEGRLDQLP